jgi:asparaginyl-tRNA synthetase
LFLFALSAYSAVNDFLNMPSPVTTIAEIGKHEGQSVTLRGWLYNLRESGKLLFPQFRDGSGVIQGVVPKNAVSPEVFEAIKTLTQESSVMVEGKVRADKRAPGGYELDVINVQVIQRVPESDPYPINGAPPFVGAVAAASVHSASARGDRESRARFL